MHNTKFEILLVVLNLKFSPLNTKFEFLCTFMLKFSVRILTLVGFLTIHKSLSVE